MVYYLQPKEIRKQLSEIIKDYNTFAFEQDEDWDEDTYTSAKKAHENAFRVIRTLFNDLARFKTKAEAVAFLGEAYERKRGAILVNHLVQNCEAKLKYTANKSYTEWHEARSLAKLRSKIDPLMTSTGNFDQPALWPLARHVR